MADSGKKLTIVIYENGKELRKIECENCVMHAVDLEYNEEGVILNDNVYLNGEIPKGKAGEKVLAAMFTNLIGSIWTNRREYYIRISNIISEIMNRIIK